MWIWRAGSSVSEEYGMLTVYNEKRWCHSRTYMDLWDVDALVQRDTAPMGLDPAADQLL